MGAVVEEASETREAERVLVVLLGEAVMVGWW